jgi:UDP-2,4-diacetamido-2,4,6-trideoxy-beta-L-altropyranose hydrolase
MRTSPSRVAFITHGGSTIGLGHIRRCLALAQGLAERGGDPIFLVSPETRLARLVEARGFKVDEIAWEENQAAATRAVRAAGASMAVVDTYAMTPEFYHSLHTSADRLVAIDDTADRPLPVDVVVNGGIGAEGLAYQTDNDALLLLGAQYALIESKFAESPDRQPAKLVERILVTLGGSAQLGAAAVALAAARSVAPDAVVDVVLGPYAEAAAGMLDRMDDGGHVNFRGHVHDVRSLMLRADLAITNAGVTLYELAASATPSIMIMTASNQSRNVQGFLGARAALFGGSASSAQLQEGLEAQIARLMSDGQLRAALGASARHLVDGRGARRVARELTRLWV